MQQHPTFKRITEPRPRNIIVLRALIAVGTVLLFLFFYWYCSDSRMGHPVLFWLLNIALGYKLLHVLFEWFYLASIQAPKPPASRREWTVDMFTTHVPGEPYDMLETTLRAMVNVRYPHTTYLCDEGDDPFLKKLCRELGVVHVYRGPDKTDAKAGNINYALKHFARGEICVILDPDHIPVPEMLDRVLPYFEDKKVGFVQSIQGYHNHGESWVAKGAAEQTYMFYGPLMMGMHRHGTVQAIGANCVFRRAALDDIGGHAAGLCEDLHTSMRLHAKKWNSVYIPELLTRGRVPATLGAFFKQQLKWSRGSFELLFTVLPAVLRSLNARQRLHYFLVPLYFFYGVVGLIELTIPAISLLSARVPLFIDFDAFVLRILAVLLSITVIRHYAQRYLLDAHEAGFHFVGGMLRVNTWWVYLLGWMYGLLRIEVPYLPTPKEGDNRSEWGILMPNIALLLLNALAIWYGLQRDFTPYSWIMAGFAGVNVFLLGYGTLLWQRGYGFHAVRLFFKKWLERYDRWWLGFRIRYVYRLMRSDIAAVFLIGLALGITALNWSSGKRRNTSVQLAAPDVKQSGLRWFRHDPSLSPNPCAFAPANTPEDTPKDIGIFRVSGSGETIIGVCATILAQCEREARLPFLIWEFFLPPAGSPDTLISTHPGVKWLGALFRNYQKPVYLCLKIKNAGPPAGTGRRKAVFNQLHNQLNEAGAGNVIFVWEYEPADSTDYPGRDYVDLVAFSLKQQVSDWPKLEQLTNAFLPHPVFLVFAGQADPAFRRKAIERLMTRKQPLFGWADESCQCKNPPGATGVRMAIWNSAAPGQSMPYTNPYRGLFYLPGEKKFEWRIAGQPYYVKGVNYNPENDWRDDHWPLTRPQLERDFDRIRDMGANTIYRTAGTVYDKNLLAVAREKELKILYSFWFDPRKDYLTDSLYRRQLETEILDFVKKHRHQPAIAAWSLGAGVWNQLDHFFYQPYLPRVRLACTRAIESIARDIKRADPSRPVLVEVYGDHQLRGALADIARTAPSVDIIAVSGQIAMQPDHIAQLVREECPGRPYLVSAFGPLWDEPFQYVSKPEPSSFEKARYYSGFWNKSVLPNRGANLGGIAYCWRDRLEGTATLSGIVDYKGRLKPAYFALKEVWTGQVQHFPLGDLLLEDKAGFSSGHYVQAIHSLYTARPDSTLLYEWYIERQESLGWVDGFSIQYGSGEDWAFKLYREYCKKTKCFYPVMGGKTVYYRHESPNPMQRVYLYISDRNGNVVTASCPIPAFQNQ